MQKATQKLEICGKESETIAREFLNLEEKNIRIFAELLSEKKKRVQKRIKRVFDGSCTTCYTVLYF